MSAAEDKAARLSGHIREDMEAQGVTSMTMTEATTAIWGTSGTGNPNAVRLIEAMGVMGYVRIYHVTKRNRRVELTPKGAACPLPSKEYT